VRSSSLPGPHRLLFPPAADVSTGHFRRITGKARDPDDGAASGAFVPVLADVKVLPEHLAETRRKLAGSWPSA
jgi:hypothetical protein